MCPRWKRHLWKVWDNTCEQLTKEAKKWRQQAAEEEQLACILPWIPQMLVATLPKWGYAQRKDIPPFQYGGMFARRMPGMLLLY